MPKTNGVDGVVVYDEDQNGYALRATINNSSAALPTTASKFALGCVLVDFITGKSYYNSGTVAVPSWNSISEVTSAEVAQDVQKVLEVSLSAANIIVMYTTAVEVVPAVAGKAIIVDDIVLDLTGTATQFTGGGVVGVQYKNTANGAGQMVHANIAASVVTGATARIITHRVGADISSIATANIVGQGLFISNKTAVFANGTGTAKLILRYHTI
jgi:hypothetical protein